MHMIPQGSRLSHNEIAAEIVRDLRPLVEPGQVLELRALNVSQKSYRAPHTVAGWFTDLEALAKTAATLEQDCSGVYVTMNPVDPDLLARACNRTRIVGKGDGSTADHNITRRTLLLVDLDPRRLSGISSTEEEHAAALARAREVRDGLHARGWPAPILASSGNGAHLVYRVDLPNDPESLALVQGTLRGLHLLYSDQAIDVDTSVCNAARIRRIYGTMARKGDDVPDRPHRRSRILDRPEEFKPVHRSLLEAIAAQVPEDPGPASTTTRTRGEAVDLQAWLSRHGILLAGPTSMQARDGSPAEKYAIRCLNGHEDGAWAAQFRSGAVAAGCHHSSCAGFDWRALRDHHEPRQHSPQQARPSAGKSKSKGKSQLDGERSQAPEQAQGRLPSIEIRGDMPRMTEEAIEALALANDPPRIFSQGTFVIRTDRIIHPTTGEAGLAPVTLTPDACRGELARCARWVEVRRGPGGREEETEQYPPLDVVRDLLSRPAEERRLPHLARIVRVPVYTPQGDLIADPGYHEPSGILHDPDPRLRGIRPPRTPSSAQVDSARRLLLEDLLGEFPFTDPASRVHALAGMMLPFVRSLISGPTPLHHVGAPEVGTGKSLLCQAILRPSLGAGDAERVHQAEANNDEWRKALTTALVKMPTAILLDNLHGRLSSGRLADALTALVWSDREIGTGQRVAAPVSCLWLSTGNNVTFSAEIARRTLAIDLDARCARPDERTGWRHPDLLAWADEHRADLVEACLTLIAAWIAAGKPSWAPTPQAPMMGSFESWCRTMGGILEVSGVPGFLTNRRESRGRTGQEDEDLRVFLAAWWQEHREQRVTAADLYPMCEQRALLDSYLRSSNDRGKRTQLGTLLRELQGRHVLAPDGEGGEISLTVVNAGASRVNVSVYRLLLAAGPGEVLQRSCSEVLQSEARKTEVFSPLQDLQDLIPPLNARGEDTHGSCACAHEGAHEVLQVLRDPAKPVESEVSPAGPACRTCAGPAEVLHAPEPDLHLPGELLL